MKKQFDVVIVGGGPTGMMLACELALFNIKALLLEKRTSTVAQSRATTVHPRTLEAFSARGILQRFIDRGQKLLGKNPKQSIWHFASMFKLQLHKLDSSCNYTLWLPQSQTEKLLEERALELGAHILRGHEVTNFIEKEDGMIIKTISQNGTYTFESSYIVGCDGAGSIIRSLANIDFPGTNSTLTSILTDIMTTRPLPSQGKLSLWSEKGMVIGVPLDEYYTRFVITHPIKTHTDKTEDVTLNEVKDCLIDIYGDDFGIENPLWMSRFGNANRLATNYRKGRVLLAGDAAHMHYPAGGQGLNYGVQDAFNLGWKLAAQIKGWAPAWLLDSYHIERHAAGEKLIYDVERQGALQSNFSKNGLTLRKFFEEQLLEISEVNLLISNELAGFHISYPSSNPEAHPLVGNRVPDLWLKTESDPIKNLYSLLYDGKFVCLFFGKYKNNIDNLWDSHVRFIVADLAEERVDYQNIRAILIRPDAHIAWISSQNETSADLTSALNAWAGKTNCT